MKSRTVKAYSYTWLIAALSGGILLYTFNTLPYLGVPYFSNETPAVFWKMQALALSGYSLLSLNMYLAARLFDQFITSKYTISLPLNYLLITLFLQLIVTITLLAIILPVFLHIIGKAWSEPWIMSIIASTAGATAYMSIPLKRRSEALLNEQFNFTVNQDSLFASIDRAELSALEAQIEPHFLFNTLAHLRRQYRIDAKKADKLLEALIAYLTQTTPALRRADWTIANEIDLIEVYLSILTQRFADRLNYVIHIDEPSRQQTIPALIIATLVENAVQHGLAPKPAGGTVVISAVCTQSQLTITVEDDGVGFNKLSGDGLGLATVQARLRSTFADKFEMIIRPRSEGGVSAKISIAI